jgi:hypothetical protein
LQDVLYGVIHKKQYGKFDAEVYDMSYMENKAWIPASLLKTAILSALVLSACAPQPVGEIPKVSPVNIEALGGCENAAFKMMPETGVHLITYDDRIDSKGQKRDPWQYIAERYNKYAPITTRKCLTADILKQFNTDLAKEWNNNQGTFMRINPALYIPSFPIYQEEWILFPYKLRQNEDRFTLGRTQNQKDTDILAFQFFNKEWCNTWLKDDIKIPPNFVRNLELPVLKSQLQASQK